MKHKLLTKIEKYNEKHGLAYDDSFKSYLIDGDFANLSVTRFTTFNPPSFIAFLDIYAIVGSIYHEIIENVLKGQENNFNKYINQYLKTIDNLQENKNAKEWEVKEYNKIKKTKKFKDIDYTNIKLWKSFENKVKRKFKNYNLVGSEITILDRWKKVVGIVDLLVEKDNKIYIFDFKTSKDINLSHFMQINVYARMLKSNYKINADSLIVVKIDRATGKMTNTKVTNLSDTIWQSLPKDCWVPPTRQIEEDEESLF